MASKRREGGLEPTAPRQPEGARFDRLDALRGLAIVWMAGFHFCFDLNHLGFWSPRQDFYGDPFWTVQRTAIVSLFLFCAGLSQAVALQARQTWPRFWRRWLQVAGCALLVSAGSALMFPKSWISFGVLHGIAVMLLLTRLLAFALPGFMTAPGPSAGTSHTRRRAGETASSSTGWLVPWVPVLLGAGCLLLPALISDPFFDTRWTNWVGLVTRKPITEDYVPVLPWLGMMLWGLAAGRWLLARRPAWLAGTLPAFARPLAGLGRWSLSFYMVHQPLLIGALMLVATMR
ncbi:MAG: DUF1624 domain-containing protein [Rubrivivax sp.]